MKPEWISYIDSKESEDSLSLSLQLMSGGFVLLPCRKDFLHSWHHLQFLLVLADDWQFPRPVPEFLLGDMMKFEASVKQLHHTPLRVNVDSCVATVVPNADAIPRYGFLFNSGSVIF